MGGLILGGNAVEAWACLTVAVAWAVALAEASCVEVRQPSSEAVHRVAVHRAAVEPLAGHRAAVVAVEDRLVLAMMAVGCLAVAVAASED